MSIYYDKFGLNTYYGTPYFQAQLPQGYPLGFVLQKCRAFRRLPPNLRKLSALAKRWENRKWPKSPIDTWSIERWYDADGYELDPDTGRRLTDAEIDAGWGSPATEFAEFATQDIPIPPGGFPDPDTWEEPVKKEVFDPEDCPSLAQLASDVMSRGVKATAEEYGISEKTLAALLNLSTTQPQNGMTYEEAKTQFSRQAARVLASPYFQVREQERAFLVEALKVAVAYDDLGRRAEDIFNRAEAYLALYDDDAGVQDLPPDAEKLLDQFLARRLHPDAEKLLDQFLAHRDNRPLVKADEPRKSCSKNSSPNTPVEQVQPEQVAPGADCIQFYTLESYLFNTVHRRFAHQGYLGAFDFFCIVIWKANRAKTKVAKRLLSNTTKTLDEVVVELTKAIAAQPTPKERMSLLMFGDIRFRLPMASAILTVLYPEEFTVYDYRVCETVGGFRNLTNLTNIDRLWEGYGAFMSAVISNSPAGLSLRNRDRYLWGKSFRDQLTTDIATAFRSASEDEVLASADAVE